MNLTDYPAPITDALSSDPAIERRDVPPRVWRAMALMEQKLAMCRAFVATVSAAKWQYMESGQMAEDADKTIESTNP